jgi:hypothetical protein
VAPAELEGILLDNKAIADAAVIGVPDDEAGEVPKGCEGSGSNRCDPHSCAADTLCCVLA